MHRQLAKAAAERHELLGADILSAKDDQLILDEREKERQAKLAAEPAALPAAE